MVGGHSLERPSAGWFEGGRPMDHHQPVIGSPIQARRTRRCPVTDLALVSSKHEARDRHTVTLPSSLFLLPSSRRVSCYWQSCHQGAQLQVIRQCRLKAVTPPFECRRGITLAPEIDSFVSAAALLYPASRILHLEATIDSIPHTPRLAAL